MKGNKTCSCQVNIRRSKSFSTSSGDTLGNLGDYVGAEWSDISFAINSSGESIAIAAEPYSSNWVQIISFGAWETGRGTGIGYAAVLCRKKHSGSSIPTNGTGVYTGYSGGVALSGSERLFCLL